MELGALSGLAAVGPWGLVAVLVSALMLAFIRGVVVPGATVDRLTSTHEAEIARLVASWTERLAESRQRELDWREAAKRADDRADTAAQQVESLMEYAHTTDAFIRSLPRGAVQ